MTTGAGDQGGDVGQRATMLPAPMPVEVNLTEDELVVLLAWAAPELLIRLLAALQGERGRRVRRTYFSFTGTEDEARELLVLATARTPDVVPRVEAAIRLARAKAGLYDTHALTPSGGLRRRGRAQRRHASGWPGAAAVSRISVTSVTMFFCSRIARAARASACSRARTTRKVMRTLSPGMASSCAMAPRARSSGNGLREAFLGGSSFRFGGIGPSFRRAGASLGAV
jgi:hypothetical protein